MSLTVLKTRERQELINPRMKNGNIHYLVEHESHIQSMGDTL
jgi:hypothetical protein